MRCVPSIKWASVPLFRKLELPVKKYKSFFFKKLLLFLSVALFFYVVHVSTSIALPSENKPLLFYSNQTRQDLKLLVRTALRSASESIYLHSYGLSDPTILSLLKHKQDEGIKVTVICDPKSAKKLPFLKEIYPVKTKGLMHEKLLVIDSKLVFLGSTNMTITSLALHDNTFLGIYHPELARYLTEHCRSKIAGIGTPNAAFYLGEKKASLFFLPDTDHTALCKIEQAILEAKKEIHVAMFTFTHPLLCEALIQAHHKGVNVTVSLDATTARGASSKIVEKLKAAGIEVYLSQGLGLFHHKWALIDQKRLILGSANWTKAAFAKNHDLFMIFEPLSVKEANFFDRLIKVIKNDFRKIS